MKTLFHHFRVRHNEPVPYFEVNIIFDTFNEGVITHENFIIMGTTLKESIKNDYIFCLAEYGGGFVKFFDAKTNELIWEYVLTQRKAKAIIYRNNRGVQEL